MALVNPRRGEVGLVIAGRRRRLCLTLGALAGLEERLGAPDLAGLAQRFAAGAPASRDLLALLQAALAGGGEALDEATVSALPLDVVEGGVGGLAEALAQVLAAAFGAGEGAPENPPEPRASPRPRPENPC